MTSRREGGGRSGWMTSMLGISRSGSSNGLIHGPFGMLDEKMIGDGTGAVVKEKQKIEEEVLNMTGQENNNKGTGQHPPTVPRIEIASPIEIKDLNRLADGVNRIADAGWWQKYGPPPSGAAAGAAMLSAIVYTARHVKL